VGDKWGYIDKTGKFSINPVYDSPGRFEHGIAMVGISSRAKNLDPNPFKGIDDKNGYIEKTGKYIWQPSN